MSKFELFVKELEELCKKYNVCLSTYSYDSLQVWDYIGGDYVYSNGINDRTRQDVTNCNTD